MVSPCFAEPRAAKATVVVALILLGVGLITGQGLKTGDLDKGAPELRPESRYNVDNSFITGNFTTSTDLMGVFVGTPEGAVRVSR